MAPWRSSHARENWSLVPMMSPRALMSVTTPTPMPLPCSTVSFPRRQIAGCTKPFASNTRPVTVVPLNALAPPPCPRSGSRMMAGLQAASSDTKGGTATSAAVAAAAAAASDMIRLFMAVLPLPVAAGRPHAMSRRRPGCGRAAIRLRPGRQPAVAEELARPGPPTSVISRRAPRSGAGEATLRRHAARRHRLPERAHAAVERRRPS